MLLPLYSQYLSPKEYAIIASMEVLAYIFGVFVNLSLERAAYRFYFDNENPHWRKDLLFTLHSSSIVLAGVWFLMALALQSLIGMIFPDIPFWPFYALVLGRTCIEVILRVPQQYLQVTEQPGYFVAISVGRFCLSVSFVMWFLVVRNEGVQGSLTGQLFSSVLLVPVGLAIGFKCFRGRFRFELLKEAMVFCWPFVPTLLVAWVIGLSDRIFLAHFATQSELGVYGMAYKIASGYILVMGAYHTAYLPRFYQLANSKDQAGALPQLKHEATNNVLLHLGLLVIAVMWSHEVVTWFLADKYANVTHILRMLFFSHLFAAIPAVTFTVAIMQAKKTKLNMYVAMAAAVINVVLNAILIPAYGMYGAALATVTSMIVLFLMQYQASKLGYFIPIPWKVMGVALPVIVALVIFFIFYIEQNMVLSLILKVLMSAGLLLYAHKLVVTNRK